MRVAVLFDNFGPYHLARLRAAAHHCEIIGVQARAKSFVYEWENRQGGIDLPVITLFPSGSAHVVKWVAALEMLEQKLAPKAPDVIAVSGWSEMVSLAATWWGLNRGIPAIVLSETNAHDSRRFFASETVKKLLLQSFSSALVGSEAHREYLATLGFPAQAVFLGYDVVDNEYFRDSAKKVRNRGMPEEGPGKYLSQRFFKRFFLSSARFVEKKNLELLINAYAQYVSFDGCNRWPLIILGDGALRTRLMERITRLGLNGQVHLPGFEQYDMLPNYYASAGAFVLPSVREQWGLVVNEAMASGLPVIVSDRCGCADSLVSEGQNGWTFDPRDCSALADLLRQMETADIDTMGRASQQIIASWGSEAFGAGLAEAACYAVRQKPKSSGVIRKTTLHVVGAIQEHRVAGAFE